MEMQARRKLKVACLHGYNTNAEFMKYQTRRLQEAFGDRLEFDFIEGPHDSPEKPDPSIESLGFNGPFKCWNVAKHIKEGGELKSIQVEGVEETMRYLS